jgi:hypothetical protein
LVVRSPIRRIRGEMEERVEDHSSVEGSKGDVVMGMRGRRIGLSGAAQARRG